MRPAFLGWTFARFREAEHLDQHGLASMLGVEPETLNRLALCRRPRPDRFGEDVHAIAARFGADVLRLASVIRQADALTTLADLPTPDVGVLAAARDRDDREAADEGADS